MALSIHSINLLKRKYISCCSHCSLHFVEAVPFSTTRPDFKPNIYKTISMCVCVCVYIKKERHIPKVQAVLWSTYLCIIFIILLNMLTQKSMQAVIFTTLCFINLSGGTCGVGCRDKEKQALLKFKQGLQDNSNILSSWESQKDCCEWRGIICNNKTGLLSRLIFIVVLSLWSNLWEVRSLLHYLSWETWIT